MKTLYRIQKEESGNGEAICRWRPKSHMLTVSGKNGTTRIYDKLGKVYEQFNFEGPSVCMEWDYSGEVLALCTENCSMLTLYEYSTKKLERLECAMHAKEFPTAMAWGKNSSILAVGTNKGNLILYDSQTAKKAPLMGKHQRMITSACFTDDDLLILAAEDSSLTVSNLDGDSLACIICNAPPKQVKSQRYRQIKEEINNSNLNVVGKSGHSYETVVSCVVQSKVFLLTFKKDWESPVYLQFQEKYGEIVAHEWYVDGYVLLGFSKGYLICLTVQQKQIGNEIFCFNDFNSNFTSLHYSHALQKCFLLGDNQLKIRTMETMNEQAGETIELQFDEIGLCEVSLTDDGRFVCCSGASGAVTVNLYKLPLLGAACKDASVTLIGLNELVINLTTDVEAVLTHRVNTTVEPQFLAISEHFIAAGAGNRCWFYSYSKKQVLLFGQIEYISSILDLKISNDYAAARILGDKIQMHRIGAESSSANIADQSILFPDAVNTNVDKPHLKEEAKVVDAFDITNHYLIYTTNTGHINHFSIDEWGLVNEYKHTCRIKWLSAEPNGSKVCYHDEKSATYIFSVHTDEILRIDDKEGIKAYYENCLWENFKIDRDGFVLYDNTTFHLYSIDEKDINGYDLVNLGTQRIPVDNKPIFLSKGCVYTVTGRGSIATALLDYFKIDMSLSHKSVGEVQKIAEQAITLKRQVNICLYYLLKWTYAWFVCDYLNDNRLWHKFANEALKNMDISVASKIYRNIGLVHLVWELEKLEFVEEKMLLAAHFSLITNDYDKAEELFLKSSEPLKALDMRRDLLHWDKALILAGQLSRKDVPIISKEYAQQLEFMGKYNDALKYYEQGLFPDQEIEEGEDRYEHNESCNCGIARTSLKTGDYKRGIAFATQIPIRSLKKECAIILEQHKQFIDAANLFQLGNFHDRAAAVSFKAKNYKKVAELLEYVRSPKIHVQYGKIMESEKKYEDAVKAYLLGKDFESGVRIYLDHLKDPEKAVKLVKESRSIEGAKLVAQFFVDIKDLKSAILFLVYSHCYQEGFHLAMTNDLVHDYEVALEEYGETAQFLDLAEYYQDKREWMKSGKFFYLAGNYPQSLEYLIRSDASDDSLVLAIKCVAASKDFHLQKILMDHLLGAFTSAPKDPKLIFRYYIELEKYQDAAKVAVILAENEQAKGNYRSVRDLLLQMALELLKHKIDLPANMYDALMVIHSYLLVKVHSQNKRPMLAARLLMRVRDNLSKFPQHQVPILTSLVIISAQAGLYETAYKVAVELMKPSNRPLLDHKFKKKIEQVARKGNTSTKDIEETSSPCLYCATPLKDFQLTCFNCKNKLPFCIVSGRHLVIDDLANCNKCHFSGCYSEFILLREKHQHCPMCNGEVSDIHKITKIEDLSYKMAGEG
uniref:WD repeat-containing protein 19 n=1 Tax=Rhabditophanes sp. KR3021 TaxID=114890 RepID=A0AC35U0Z1_9BILA